MPVKKILTQTRQAKQSINLIALKYSKTVSLIPISILQAEQWALFNERGNDVKIGAVWVDKVAIREITQGEVFAN